MRTKENADETKKKGKEDEDEDERREVDKGTISLALQGTDERWRGSWI